MRAEHDRRADRQQRAEPIRRPRRRAHDAPEQQDEGTDHQETAGEADLLGHPGKKEVIVRRRFRQVAEAGLRAVADALTAETAATDRDDGLVDVPSDAEPLRVDDVGGDEGHDALALVVLEQEEPSLRLVLAADRAHGVLGLRIRLRILVDLGRIFGQVDGHHAHQQDGGGSGHQEEPGGQAGDEQQDE